VDKVPRAKVEPVRNDNGLLKDMGAASKATKGSALDFPWYESSIPPFNHVYCPYC
jgi:hypothetical protein